MKNKALVILGPTATGKTDLALLLAQKLNGELIACDSRQVYKGLEIGTGKNVSQSLIRQPVIQKYEKRWKINGVNVWMYDVVDPKYQYTVLDYVNDANKIIFNIICHKKLPIIVGGSGFYLKALIDGLDNLNVPTNRQLRKKLEKLSLSVLQKGLKDLSDKKWNELNKSDQQNKRRLLRSIELISMNPYKSNKQIPNLKSLNIQILKVGLTAPRLIINKKIDLRILTRLNSGMIKETENLHKNGLSYKRMKELGLEYALLSEYLQSLISKDQLIEKLKDKIHQYAKRQLTWFKKEKDVFWFDITKKNWLTKVEKLTLAWYNNAYDA